MFKKTLVAAAMAGALVGSAFAANVTLYGLVDEGLVYQHSSTTGFNGVKTTENNFTMDSGVDSESRWGLQGTEELGNGYAVSFKLESGFAADDGTMSESRLFRREASLTVSGPFGQLSMGRMGGVASSAGTYDVVYSIGDAFDGGGSLVGPYIASARYDNMVTYQTPKFAGVQATAQYSFKQNNTDKTGATVYGAEGKSSANRYAAFALSGEFGNFQAVAAYERLIAGNVNYDEDGKNLGRNNNKDTNVFHLGGNYDFGVAKVFLMGQYFNGARAVKDHSVDGLSFLTDAQAKAVDTTDGLKGYGLQLGTVVPVAGGDLTAAFYYQRAKSDTLTVATDESFKTKSNFYAAEVRYEYPLSKRTTVYGGAAYGYQKVEADNTNFELTGYESDQKNKVAGAYLGLMHKF